MREAVARACLALLVEGDLELAPATVAERSGVSRKTIYRWWPTRTELLHDALGFHTRRLEPPDTGSWAGDVRALVEQLAAFLSDPIERAQNAILASGRDPDFNRLMLDHYGPIQAGWAGVVERGIARGEVEPDVDPARVVSLLISPLLVTTLFERRKPSAKEIREHARLIVRATASSGEPSSGRAVAGRRGAPGR
ncbi:MAG: TetR/AcrR family transcriptional regulator C-terminal ligand-binding domain-containing protein [Myxococcota bacterium]